VQGQAAEQVLKPRAGWRFRRTGISCIHASHGDGRQSGRLTSAWQASQSGWTSARTSRQEYHMQKLNSHAWLRFAMWLGVATACDNEGAVRLAAV
jgi:hypothetical protein